MDKPLTLIGDTPQQVVGGRLSSYAVSGFEELAARWGSGGIVVLDVRRPDEWRAGHLPGAVHIPFWELEQRAGEVPAGEVPAGEVWVHCASGFRAAIGASLLDRAGRQVVHIDDDWEHAGQAGLPACPAATEDGRTPSDLLQRWAKVLDQDKCIGCHACTTACKSENEVPFGVTRTYVKSAEVGTFPQVRRAFQVTRCNQCADVPCTTACPTEAILVGELNDPESKVAQIVNCEAVTVRRPKKSTRPGLFYKGAHQATLDPLAARQISQPCSR